MNFRYQLSTIILILSCFFSITIKAQRLSHKLDIRITQPSYLSGSYEYGSPVDFGPTAIPVTSGDLVWAYDVNGDSTACNTITTDLTDKIALIRRGGCSFVDKIYGAQQRGAIAVVIINNTDDDLNMDMTSSTNGHLVNIPAVFVSGNTGKKLASTLDSGKTVKLEFYPPSVEYCQFNHYSKVPLKYAPDIDKASVQIYNHTKTEQKNVKVSLRFIDPKNNTTTWDTIIPTIAPLSKGYANYENTCILLNCMFNEGNTCIQYLLTQDHQN